MPDETPAHSADRDADETGIRPHGMPVPARVAQPEPDGPEDGVLMYAPTFHSFEVRNLTITDTGTRVPKSRVTEVHNAAKALGLEAREA